MVNVIQEAMLENIAGALDLSPDGLGRVGSSVGERLPSWPQDPAAAPESDPCLEPNPIGEHDRRRQERRPAGAQPWVLVAVVDPN